MSIKVYQQDEVLLEDALTWGDDSLLDPRVYRDDMLRLLGEQSAVVIHELRSPLQAVSAQLQVTRRLLHREVGDRHDARFDMIFAQLHQAEEMMDQFLQLGSLREPQLEWVDLVETCIQCAQLLRSLCIENRVDLLVRDDVELCLIWADGGKLRQVLVNLIVNAAQACAAAGKGPGQILIDLEDELRPEGHFQLLRVRDTGCGIPEDALDKLFEPYFTTKEKGTGLGLSICQQIAAWHKGEIWAENNPDGNGASFFLRLPVDPRRIY